MESFYRDLAPFSTFAEFADIGDYAPVPEDWTVMVADVRGSTRAIEEGRYKDVNMVGAAAITGVLNACGAVEVPFVFGGDGAALVVPPSVAAPAKQALMGLAALSRARFGLELRIGAVPVANLRALRADLRVRKLELSPGNFLAMFSGGGIELAETLLKAEPADPRYVLEASADAEPDLEGLSCRWEPLTPRGGRMLTLMVRGTSGNTIIERKLLHDLIDRITAVLGGDAGAAAPANPYSMRFRWPPRGLRLEARATAGEGSFLGRYAKIFIQSLIQFWCERFDRKAGDYDAPRYREELRAYTDYRKYDDMLRMVLDVTDDQAAAIERYLEEEYRKGDLVYGTFVTDRALMTCLVFSLEQSEHVHFVDGANGGFALAAKGFKQRLVQRGA